MTLRWATFRSSRFGHRSPGPHFINPTCFGEDLAAWLRPHLQAAGLQLSEPIQEDYGWGLWTRADGDPYWIAIGAFGDDTPETEAEWGIGVSYDPGFNLPQATVPPPGRGGPPAGGHGHRRSAEGRTLDPAGGTVARDAAPGGA